MKRALCILLILLFLAAFLLLIPSGTLAEAVTIPVDSDPKLGASEECYIYEDGNASPVGYEDPTLSISLSRGFYNGTSYVAAKVKVASVTQLRSTFSGRFGSQNASLATKIARSVNSVLAVNGDFYTDKGGYSYVTRQGHEYRKKCSGNVSDSSKRDILVIDYHGDLHILQKPDNNAIDALIATLDEADPAITGEFDDKKVYQSFTFGPGLVIDSVQQKGFTNKSNENIAAEIPAQRMAIAQTGPLEYLFISTAGPEDKKRDGSTGLTLDEFSDLVYSFGGIINAYNLDGGSSSTMVFRTSDGKFDKINSTKGSKTRPVVDIIYFASAWNSAGSVE